MKHYIERRRYPTGTSPEVIKRIDVSDKPDKLIDSIESGININLNHNEYYTRQILTDKELKIIQ